MNRCKGSVLLETLLSMVVIAVASLSLVSLQANVLQSKTLSLQNAEATLLAHSKIEESRNFANDSEYSALNNSKDSMTSTNASYSRSLNIINHTAPYYKELTVTIGWQDTKGQDNQLVLSSTIGNLSVVNSGKVMATLSPTTPLVPGNANYSP
jgi:Tfp pilus assembly protein PilV